MAHVADWDSQLAPLHCLNFGIGGDRTENVLWRVMNGELDNINAKVVVIWCGTNNHGNSAEQVSMPNVFVFCHSSAPCWIIFVLAIKSSIITTSNAALLRRFDST